MLKLHFAPNSRAGRIVWLLEELGLSYDINKMAFHPQDLKSDEHRSRHPLGRVPVLEDGEISIYESGAIVEYIIERHKNGGLKPEIESDLYPMSYRSPSFSQVLLHRQLNSFQYRFRNHLIRWPT